MARENIDLALFEADGEVSGSSAHIRQCQVIPLSLKALQVYCDKKGHSSVIIVQGGESRESLVKKILSYNPRIAAATASACEFPETAEVMKRVKQENREIVTVVGGYHASAYPQSLDSRLCSPDTDPTGIDLLVIGEGEKTLDLITHCVKSCNLDLHKRYIRGIAYLLNGELTINEPRELICNLDELPRVDWTEEELGRNVFDGLIARPSPKDKKIAAVISERGCPYACSFCSTQNVYGRAVRTRSIESLTDEIEFLIKERNVDLIVDYAPTANRDPSRVHDLCNEMIRRGLEQQASLYQLWRLESPNGKLMITEDLPEVLSKAFFGFKAGIGVEALTENDEDYIAKRHSLANLQEASANFDKYGGMFRGFFMITPETTTEAIRACSESKSLALFDDLRVTYLVPYPGAPLYEQVKDRLITRNWRDFTCQKPVIKSNYLNDEQYANAQRDITQGFLLNPHRQKRLREKVARHPRLEQGVARYHEKMREHGFKVLGL